MNYLEFAETVHMQNNQLPCNPDFIFYDNKRNHYFELEIKDFIKDENNEVKTVVFVKTKRVIK